MTSFDLGSKVFVTKNINGTGIKMGWEGRVICVQDGTRGIGRSTDLNSVAFQVRFRGGAEIWMTADELAPNEVGGLPRVEIRHPASISRQKPTEC